MSIPWANQHLCLEESLSKYLENRLLRWHIDVKHSFGMGSLEPSLDPWPPARAKMTVVTFPYLIWWGRDQPGTSFPFPLYFLPNSCRISAVDIVNSGSLNSIEFIFDALLTSLSFGSMITVFVKCLANVIWIKCLEIRTEYRVSFSSTLSPPTTVNFSNP